MVSNGNVCHQSFRLFLVILCVRCFLHIQALRISVFGATGGVGQLICKRLLSEDYSVKAITRDPSSAKSFENLKGCDIIQADARQTDTLHNAVINTDVFIISVGTTAFPTKKWKNGNTPRVACVETVENILNSIQSNKVSPKAIILLSSIGVERTKSPPFNILNSFGILDAKLESENLLLKRCQDSLLDTVGVVVRPGRLVGAPFTNFDLAKLFNISQSEDNQGIVLDTRDVLSGDVERQDVAEVIARIIKSTCESSSSTSPSATTTKLTFDKNLPTTLSASQKQKNIVFSVINKPGKRPNELQWGKLLSLFTVPIEVMLTTRNSD